MHWLVSYNTGISLYIHTIQCCMNIRLNLVPMIKSPRPEQGAWDALTKCLNFQSIWRNMVGWGPCPASPSRGYAHHPLRKRNRGHFRDPIPVQAQYMYYRTNEHHKILKTHGAIYVTYKFGYHLINLVDMSSKLESCLVISYISLITN